MTPSMLRKKRWIACSALALLVSLPASAPARERSVVPEARRRGRLGRGRRAGRRESLRQWASELHRRLFVPSRGRRRGQRRQLDRMLDHIDRSWSKLTYDHAKVLSSRDWRQAGRGKQIVYVSAKESTARVRRELAKQTPAAELAKTEIRRLPDDPTKIKEHGLLYLPHPYVVPSERRFAHQYGWDSYYIVSGLLRDGKTELARQMTDNALYEVEHYGKVLNANHTYFLGRSQPPLLSQMVVDVYRKTRDRAWLERALPALEKYYRYWTEGSRKTPETGLSRYHIESKTPTPEILAEGGVDFRNYEKYFQKKLASASPREAQEISRLFDANEKKLTDLAYAEDRAMRSTGFDISFRFGPFSLEVDRYNPVGLNSLLYRMAADIAVIHRALGDRDAATSWHERATTLRGKVNELLWDDKAGLYLDRNIDSGQRRDYPYATTFFPLWAGVATPKEAKRVAENLRLFERPGGLATSTHNSGAQWDGDIVWAPMMMMAAKGLRRYGYHEQADRISVKYLSMVLGEFKRTGKIFEKYDAGRRSSEVSRLIRYGYRTNEEGFGWTNAAVVQLLGDLPRQKQGELLERAGVSRPSSAAQRSHDSAVPYRRPAGRHSYLRALWKRSSALQPAH